MVGKFYVGQATTVFFFFFPAAGGSEAGRGGGGWVGWCACTVAHARSRVCEFFCLATNRRLSLTQTFAPPIGTGLSVLIKRLRAKPKQGSATGGESSGCHSTRANQAQGICDFRCLRAGSQRFVAARCSRPRSLVKAWEMLVGARSWGKSGTAPYGVTRISCLRLVVKGVMPQG